MFSAVKGFGLNAAQGLSRKDRKGMRAMVAVMCDPEERGWPTD
jgi:hypothetical protein